MNSVHTAGCTLSITADWRVDSPLESGRFGMEISIGESPRQPAAEMAEGSAEARPTPQ